MVATFDFPQRHVDSGSPQLLRQCARLVNLDEGVGIAMEQKGRREVFESRKLWQDVRDCCTEFSGEIWPRGGRNCSKLSRDALLAGEYVDQGAGLEHVQQQKRSRIGAIREREGDRRRGRISGLLEDLPARYEIAKEWDTGQERLCGVRQTVSPSTDRARLEWTNRSSPEDTSP